MCYYTRHGLQSNNCPKPKSVCIFSPIKNTFLLCEKIHFQNRVLCYTLFSLTSEWFKWGIKNIIVSQTKGSFFASTITAKWFGQLIFSLWYFLTSIATAILIMIMFSKLSSKPIFVPDCQLVMVLMSLHISLIALNCSNSSTHSSQVIGSKNTQSK